MYCESSPLRKEVEGRLCINSAKTANGMSSVPASAGGVQYRLTNEWNELAESGEGVLMRLFNYQTNVEYTQAWGCRLCVHIGGLALYFGRKKNGRGPRIEIMTTLHWFRYSHGYEENR